MDGHLDSLVFGLSFVELSSRGWQCVLGLCSHQSGHVRSSACWTPPPLPLNPRAAPGTSSQVSVLGISFHGVTVSGLSVSGFLHQRVSGPHAVACITSHPFPVAPGRGHSCPGFCGVFVLSCCGDMPRSGITRSDGNLVYLLGGLSH